MNRVIQIVLGVVVLVVVAGGSFYGGMVYGEGQGQSGTPAGVGFVGGPPGGYNAGPGGQGGQGQGQQGGGLVGEIAEIGDGYLVVTDNNGKQTKVAVADTTLIRRTPRSS